MTCTAALLDCERLVREWRIASINKLLCLIGVPLLVAVVAGFFGSVEMLGWVRLFQVPYPVGLGGLSSWRLKGAAGAWRHFE